MGRIGAGEVLLVVLVILLLFGQKKLPELGSALGEFIKRFKKASQGIEDEILLRRAHLQEAELFIIAAETVGLRVHGQALPRDDSLQGG